MLNNTVGSSYQNKSRLIKSEMTQQTDPREEQGFMITGKNLFLDTSRILQQQERKVARVDLLIASLLDF